MFDSQPDAATLVDILRRRAAQQPESPAFTFLGAATEARLSYAELDAESCRIARCLLARVAPGDRVALLCPPGLAYVTLLYGCLYAGVVAVPLYPPRARQRTDRLERVLESCGARLVVTVDESLDTLREHLAGGSTPAAALISMGQLADLPPTALPAPPRSSQAAFIQYTSGSTGVPKGVVVSHANIIANLTALRDVVDFRADDVFVNWLPLFHDLGLITTAMLPMFLGAHSVLMSAASFVQSPILWLEAISRFRGTICGAPDFAFALCADRIGDEQLRGLDLSSWLVAFNAAEPIHPATLARFSARFAGIGFQASALYPAYGMAEATVFLAGGTRLEGPKVQRFERAGLLRGVALATDDENGRSLVACGRPLPLHALVIVDRDTQRRLPDQRIGEIWAAGPSIAMGYWGLDALSEVTFRARLDGGGDTPYLQTGDLGFMFDGQIYVSGRCKDLIIIRGQNHYPQDIERIAALSDPALVPAGAAAFGVGDVAERLVVVQEVRAGSLRSADMAQLAAHIRRAIAVEFELDADVVLIRPGTLPKTSSGKVQRSETRARHLAGTLARLNAGERSPPLPSPALGGTQASIAALFGDVLGAPVQTADADFFSLGGDSLVATRLIARIERHFGYRLSLDQLHHTSTVAALAAHLDAGVAGAACASIPPTPGNEAPLSSAQRRLWLMNQSSQQSRGFNLCAGFELRGAIDVARLARAFAQTVQHHDILRTTYHWDGERLSQRIGSAAEMVVAVEDLRHRDDPAGDAAALAREEVQAPFDLAGGPVMRVRLLKLAPELHHLLVSVHHIAADAWSAEILLGEVSALYAEPGTALALPALRYADYAAWEASRVDTQRLAAAVKRLFGAPSLLPLPYDRPRPTRQSFDGAVHAAELGSALVAALKALSARHRTTLFVSLLSAFQLLLKRLSGLDDIVIGTDVANRERAQLSDVAGFFVNQIVLRGDLRDCSSLEALLLRNRSSVLEALAEQDLPFDRIVAELGGERDSRHAPIFQVKFLLNPAPLGGFRLDGLGVEPLPLPTLHVQYDLTLSIDPSAQGYRASFHYNSDLFDPATVAGFMDDYLAILHALAERPQQPLPEVPSAQTSSELYRSWGIGRVRVPAASLTERFETQARHTPDAVAVISATETLSYQRLQQLSNQLAHLLRALDVGPGSIVGIHLARSANQLIALLAVAKLGASFLPLDQEYPAERIAYILDDSRTEIVITDDPEHAQLDHFLGTRLPLDATRALLQDESDDELPALEAGPQSAYLLYTSGSSGRPKGVSISHSSLLNLCCWYQDFARLGLASAVLQVIPLSFDASIKNLLTPLLCGGRVVLAPPGPLDAAALTRTVADHGVTLINCVPSLFYLLLEQAARQGYQPLRSLALVALGGESTDLARLKDWMSSPHCSASLANLYGPTECADISAAYQAPCRELIGETALPIGGPVDNARLHVVDADLRPCPPGVPGELLIAGAGVALGYVGQAAALEPRFIADPFGGGGRIYRSGDIVRYDRQGRLHYLGRADAQVKVNGVRIEVAEIETALGELDGVRRAAVLQVGDRLCAYVESASLNPPSAAQLREQLRRRLPRMWIPKAFVVLESLPLLPNGKIDQNALRSIPAADPFERRDVTPPANEAERALVEVFGRVLERVDIGVDESFFELGGDSMSAVRVVALADDAGLHLSVADIFDDQTPRALAARAATAGPRTAEPPPAGSDVQVFDLLSEEDLAALMARSLSAAPAPGELRR